MFLKTPRASVKAHALSMSSLHDSTKKGPPLVRTQMNFTLCMGRYKVAPRSGKEHSHTTGQVRTRKAHGDKSHGHANGDRDTPSLGFVARIKSVEPGRFGVQEIRVLAHVFLRHSVCDVFPYVACVSALLACVCQALSCA